jgi:hypothetical protein
MTIRDRVLFRGLAVCLAGLAWATVAVGSPVPPRPQVVYKVGQVTWHAQRFIDQEVVLSGYLLTREKGYVIVSDEPSGRISAHDLPVIGPGLDQMQPMKRYLMEGKFLDHGLLASNGNRYHLELAAAPEQERP